VKIKSVGIVALFTAIAAIALTGCLLAPPDQLVVNTTDGKVHGKLINDGKILAFQGIPYAAPPVGNLRWQAPQPVAGWNSELDATKFGRHCPQNHVFTDMVYQDSSTPDDSGSEDCLTVNVYSPVRKHNNARLPVMFWIHGGGYTEGASSEPRHNGDFLPLKGVVLVTINY
jgi:para-nitrobenzyl esterase